MCNGRGTPGNNTTGKGKSGNSRTPLTRSIISLMINDSSTEAINLIQKHQASTPNETTKQNLKDESLSQTDRQKSVAGVMQEVWLGRAHTARPETLGRIPFLTGNHSSLNYLCGKRSSQSPADAEALDGAWRRATSQCRKACRKTRLPRERSKLFGTQCRWRK